MRKIILLTTMGLIFIVFVQGLSFSEKQKLIKEQYIKRIQEQYNISEQKALELQKEIENKFDEKRVQLEVMRRLAINNSMENKDIVSNNGKNKNKINSRFNKKVKNKEKIKTKLEMIKEFVEDKIMGFRPIHEKGGKGNHLKVNGIWDNPGRD